MEEAGVLTLGGQVLENGDLDLILPPVRSVIVSKPEGLPVAIL